MRTITVALSQVHSLKRAKAMLKGLKIKIMNTNYEEMPRFRGNEEVPNETTLEAMEEAERLINDPHTKYFTNVKDLMDALND